MPKMRIMQTLVDKVNLISRENLEGMLVIRAFNSQKFEEARFDAANRTLTENSLFVNRAMTIMMPTMMFIMNVTTVLIVWVGAQQIAAMQIDIGKMMAFMQYAMQIIMSFLMLSVMFILIPRAMVSAGRIKEVIETGTVVKDKIKAIRPRADFVPDIEYENVTFCYPGGDEPVLKNISFKAKHGRNDRIYRRDREWEIDPGEPADPLLRRDRRAHPGGRSRHPRYETQRSAHEDRLCSAKEHAVLRNGPVQPAVCG